MKDVESRKILFKTNPRLFHTSRSTWGQGPSPPLTDVYHLLLLFLSASHLPSRNRFSSWPVAGRRQPRRSVLKATEQHIPPPGAISVASRTPRRRSLFYLNSTPRSVHKFHDGEPVEHRDRDHGAEDQSSCSGATRLLHALWELRCERGG